MRTFSRADWETAQAAWDSGEFSDEWKPFRHQAAMGGLVFPPDGTRWDSWEDDSPSQRAMLIRAIREQPSLLRSCITGARSWSQVLDRLLAKRDDWREEQREREADAARQRAADEPRRGQAAMSVGKIIDRMAESLGYSRETPA